MFKCAEGHISAPYEAEKRVPVAVRTVTTEILSNHRFDKKSEKVVFNKRPPFSRTEIVRTVSLCPLHAEGEHEAILLSGTKVEELILDPAAKEEAEAAKALWLEKQRGAAVKKEPAEVEQAQRREVAPGALAEFRKAFASTSGSSDDPEV